ncbi:DUF485 domain-containing protein [bacterium]|nr:DUF485 domain-containing protein [bacterium]
MLHKPAVQEGTDHAVAYKMRLGMIMFLIYAVVYAGFVAINVLSPILMEARVLLGLNLAVVYGFGLIVFALFLALIYNAMCVKKEKLLNTNDKNGKEGDQ